MRRRWFGWVALAAVLGAAPMHAQATGTIRGQVINAETKSPLAGVRVSFAGKSVLTHSDGKYALPGAPAGSDTLRVRYLGYAPQSMPYTLRAGAEQVFDIALTPLAVTLSELIVTGYGAQRAGDITGAVSAVSAEEFNTGRVISPAELIAAKAPGVQVVDNNEPGGGKTIRIRGATSVNASSDPLYIIDGMPLGTGAGGGLSAGRDPLNFLNPNDIENITVLRDASAAAIYGANAANGVVIITTKSRAGAGRQGAQFEYTSSVSSSSVDRLPSMLNATQFRAAVQQFAPQNAGQLGTASTNWFDLVTRTAIGQDHNLSISNAGETSSYRLSFGYLNQDGILEGTTAERLSLGFAYNQRLFEDRLDVRANIKGSRALDLFTPGGVLGNAAQMGPSQPVFDPANPTGYYEWPGNTLTSADNPLAILNLATDRGTTYRSVGNVQAAYVVPWVTGLKANVNVGYDLTRVTRTAFRPSVLHDQQKTGQRGTDSRNEPNALNTILDAYLNYVATPNAIPGTIDLTAGYSYNDAYAENPFYFASGLSSDVLGGNGYTSATTVQNGLDIQESRLISFFGRANYNLNDKYLVGFSVRRDGSSRFGPDNAWGTFPSASLGWRLSEESFLKGKGTFDDLKLRASWARTGNQAFGNYLQFSSYRFGDNQTQVQFGDVFIPTIRPSAVDRNIKWEATTAINLGVDFALGGGKITGAFDWYTKDTDDLIFNVPVAAGTNLSNFVTTNIGSMKNTGVELTLNATLLDRGRTGLNWSTSFNISHNRNELVNIAGSVDEILTGGVAGGVGTTIQVLRPGVPVNSFYVYEHKLEDGKPIYRDTDGNGSINETDLYVDRNGDGIINVADRRPFENPAPDWILGFSNYLTRGNWDLNFTLRAFLGNYVYNNVASNLGTYAELTRASPYNLHTSVLETGFVTPQYLSDYYVEDGSFLRMDNIQLGYNTRLGGRPVRLSATVQNAFTITGYSGVDPTAGLNGIDNNIYPRARTVTVGLNWRF